MVEYTLQLPDWAADYLQQQVEAGHFDSKNDCLIHIIERARRIQSAKDRLAELVMEGENSGEGIEYSEEDWPARRDRIIAELQKKSA